MMEDLIVMSREQLFMLLGEFALPREGDCAPVATELIKRVNGIDLTFNYDLVPR